MRRSWLISLIGLGLLLTLHALPVVRVAHADPPGIRGDEPLAQGSTSDDSLWHDIQPLAPLNRPIVQPTHQRLNQPLNTTPLPPLRSSSDARQNTIAPSAWLGRPLNPGNWVLDAGLGIATGQGQTQVELAQQGIQLFTGSSADPCLRIIFCTDVDVFFNADGSPSTLDTIWFALQPIAISLAVLLFTWRIGEMVFAGSHMLHTEGRQTLLAFIATMIVLTQLRWLVEQLLRFWAMLNQLVLQLAPIPVKPQFGLLDLLAVLPGFSLAATYLLKAIAVLALALVFVALLRLVKLFVLLAVAPLVTVCIMSRATIGYARAWANKLIDTLMQQTIWALSFGLGSVIVGRMRDTSPIGTSSFFGEAFALLVLLLLALCSTTILRDVFTERGGEHQLLAALVRVQVARSIGGRLPSVIAGTSSHGRPPITTSAQEGSAPSAVAATSGASGRNWRHMLHNIGQRTWRDPLALPRRMVGASIRRVRGSDPPSAQTRWNTEFAAAQLQFRQADPEPPRGTQAYSEWHKRHQTFVQQFEASHTYPVPSVPQQVPAGDVARRLLGPFKLRQSRSSHSPTQSAQPGDEGNGKEGR